MRSLLNMFVRQVCAACLMLSGAGMVHAADYASVGTAFAILYNAPSERGRKVFIAPRGMPVEVILQQDGWTKIRDASTDLSWIESHSLSRQRTVIATSDRMRIMAAGSDDAAQLSTADKGVLFNLQAVAANGWLRVAHVDGTVGFVRASDVWGD